MSKHYANNKIKSASACLLEKLNFKIPQSTFMLCLLSRRYNSMDDQQDVNNYEAYACDVIDGGDFKEPHRGGN